MDYPGRNVVDWNQSGVASMDLDRDADQAIGPDASEEPSLDDERLLPTGFAEWFVVLQTALPGALYLPGSQAYRLPLRMGAYVIALVGFALWWFRSGAQRPGRHPAERWLVFVLSYLVLMIFHPLTSGLLAGVAQTLLYASIFCSVFWVQAFVTRPRQLVRILAILLVCNGINSVVGVLQVYDPLRFMPTQLSLSLSRAALAASTFIGPNGRPMMRPPGLFDTPGAVCGPGTVAALLGLVFAVESFAWWKRAAALLLSLAGISAIYLSHVRASLVVTLGMMVVYAAVLVLQNQKARLTVFSSLGVGIIFVGLTATTIIGGEGIRERFSTLLGNDPQKLYFESRGNQLQTGFTELASQYPFGAGLARWGMMHGYFADRSNLDSTEIWAEVQPSVWLLDGGLVLLCAYSLALLVTVWKEWKTTMGLASRDDRLWAATVAAVNIGTLALVFSFVPFVTQVGLQYWFLEGALYGAMLGQPRRS
jgi:hypothetical protein